jgi:hypothetical protein
MLCIRSGAVYIFNNSLFFHMELCGCDKKSQENGLSVKIEGKHRVEMFMGEEGQYN